jgi:ribonuclease HI
MKFYAVYRGHTKGVFNNWTECQESINGYSNAIFKKCSTQSEGDYFIANGYLPTKKYEKLDKYFTTNVVVKDKPSRPTSFFTEKTQYEKLDKYFIGVVDSDDEDSKPSKPPPAPKPILPPKPPPKSVLNEPIYVYTDGSCIHNGKPNAKAGIGVYFAENDPRNVSRKFGGKQSNNTAELSAIIDVSDILKDEINNNETIVICSDSQYAIRCCSTYGAKLASNGWTEEKPNLELVKKAYNIYRNKYNVTFKHIFAHTGKQDRHSIGNDGADRMANMAIGLNQCPYSGDKPDERKPQKIYLNVEFSQKDDAKKMGAKWDFRKKKWYINEDAKTKDILVLRYPR